MAAAGVLVQSVAPIPGHLLQVWDAGLEGPPWAAKGNSPQGYPHRSRGWGQPQLLALLGGSPPDALGPPRCPSKP